MRNDYASGRNESVRLPEIRLPHVTDEVISEIRAVSQVEHLEERGDCVAFFDSKVLADARVKLEEGLAAQIVKGEDGTLSSPQAVPITLGGSPKCFKGGEEIVRTSVEDDHVSSPATVARA